MISERTVPMCLPSMHAILKVISFCAFVLKNQRGENVTCSDSNTSTCTEKATQSWSLCCLWSNPAGAMQSKTKPLLLACCTNFGEIVSERNWVGTRVQIYKSATTDMSFGVIEQIKIETKWYATCMVYGPINWDLQRVYSPPNLP